jgi:hypothetical protein
VSGTHVVAALANSSALELSEYTPNELITAEIVRNGVVIGSATGAVDDGSVDPKLSPPGTFNVNPTHCWSNYTPVILPGDTVRVRPADPAPQTWVDETVVKNITVDTIAETAPGVVTVTGTATQSDGTQLLPDEIQNRLISKGAAFAKSGSKRLRTGHVGVAGEGTIAYDEPGSPTNMHWTAVYPGLIPSDVALALTADVRGLWAPALVVPQEVTIMIKDAIPAPAAGCNAPVAQNAVTHASPAVINLATVGPDLVVNGVSFDATQVDVKVDDADPNTAALHATTTITGAVGPQTWTAAPFPAADIATLSDGPLKVTGTYLIGGNPVPGQDLILQKDLVAPAAPTASPGSGTYPETQAVLLQHSDTGAGAKVVYTTDGSDPTPTSTRATGQTFVSSSLTLKAMVIDGAGNTSPIASFAYSIVRPASGGSGTGSSGGGAGTTGTGGSTKAKAPVVSSLKGACIPAGTSAARKRAKCRAGVSFSLSAAAQVKLVVRNSRGAVIGAFTLSGVKGRNTWTLPAKTAGRALKPGKYTVALTATAAGLTGAKVSTSVKVPKA